MMKIVKETYIKITLVMNIYFNFFRFLSDFLSLSFRKYDAKLQKTYLSI